MVSISPTIPPSAIWGTGSSAGTGGRALASEASRALLRHAFDTVGQSRVIAQTMAANAGSIGVMRAIGMRYVRTYYPQFDDPLPDAHLGEVEYEMTRTMWEEMR